MSITIPTGVYQHADGKLYYVLGMAREHETGEMRVVYIPLYQAQTSIPTGVQMSVTTVERFTRRFKRIDKGGQE